MLEWPQNTKLATKVWKSQVENIGKVYGYTYDENRKKIKDKKEKSLKNRPQKRSINHTK